MMAIFQAGSEVGLIALIAASFNPGMATVARSNLFKAVVRYGTNGGRFLVHFGQNPNQLYHAFRHTDSFGLSRNLAFRVIHNDFKQVFTQVVAGKPFNRIVTIGGKSFDMLPTNYLMVRIT